MASKYVALFNFKKFNIRPDGILIWLDQVPPSKTSGGIILDQEQRDPLAFYATTGIVARIGSDFKWPGKKKITIGSKLFFTHHTGFIMLSQLENYYRVIHKIEDIHGWELTDINKDSIPNE
jgi:hypothetical protein